MSDEPQHWQHKCRVVSGITSRRPMFYAQARTTSGISRWNSEKRHYLGFIEFHNTHLFIDNIT